MRDLIKGTFHFHSTYSHDGRHTLSEIVSALSGRGFSFCVMTEHFEDFDGPKFDRYVLEAHAISQSSGFILIPGVEVDLSGLHTIVFPAQDYAQIVRLASNGQDSPDGMFKVLAHPSKYPFEAVARRMAEYNIDGVELWNQQADGRYIPPISFLESLTTQSRRNQYRYFFGCDIHDVNLTISNIISLSTSQHTADGVVRALIEGDFVTRNDSTGIEYRNGSEGTNFDAWLQAVLERPFYRGKLSRSLRRFLKPVYSVLPRDVRRSLNDVKNFVRNKI